MQQFLTIGLAAQFARFGEAAQYLKHGVETPRDITVIVDREPPEDLAAAPGVPTPRIELHVRNDATHGIAATELNRGADQVSFAWRLGGEVKTYQIGRLMRQDAGVLVLEIR